MLMMRLADKFFHWIASYSFLYSDHHIDGDLEKLEHLEFVKSLALLEQAVWKAKQVEADLSQVFGHRSVSKQMVKMFQT